MKKLSLFTTLALGLFTASLATAQTPWSSTCSAGATIDEASAGLYQLNGPSLLFAPGAVGQIVARYNVTNTTGMPVAPWNNLALGYGDPVGGLITATLFQVNYCTGIRMAICSVVSGAGIGVCGVCAFPAGTVINFNANLYQVELQVNKPAAGINVRANTLEIF
jgi:hypothetical protein